MSAQEANICGARQPFSCLAHVNPSGPTHVNFQFSLTVFYRTISVDPYIAALHDFLRLFHQLYCMTLCNLQACLPRSHDICC